MFGVDSRLGHDETGRQPSMRDLRPYSDRPAGGVESAVKSITGEGRKSRHLRFWSSVGTYVYVLCPMLYL